MIQPHFLVIGAYKSGTTALHHYLRAHPEIFIPQRKEPNFFAFADQVSPFDFPAASTSIRDRTSYDRLFLGAQNNQKLGEVSPAYLAVSSACDRIRVDAPKTHLIAILRNPAERAYSDYLMYRRDGLEHEESFIDALHKQNSRDSSVDPTSHYVSTGFYFKQLGPYFKTFRHDQIRILLHEELSTDREGVLRNLFEFIGVDPTVEIADQDPSNVSGVPTSLPLRLAYTFRNRFKNQLRNVIPAPIKRSIDAGLERHLTREPMPLEARAFLIDTYRTDVELLGTLIDRDLSSWLRP